MLVSKNGSNPLEFAVLMNDTVQVCRFDAEPLGSLGTVARQKIAFFQQCVDVHWTVRLLGLSLYRAAGRGV
jgi:hypothetical protein